MGEVVMFKEVLADGERALIISQADEERVVRLVEPLLHQPVRATRCCWSPGPGTCTSGSRRPRSKS